MDWLDMLLGFLIDERFLLAAGVFLSVVGVSYVLRYVVLRRLEKAARNSVTQFDDVVVAAVQSISMWGYGAVAVYVAVQFYGQLTWMESWLPGVMAVILVWQGIRVCSQIVSYVTAQVVEKDEDGDGVADPASATMSSMVTLLFQIAMWAVGGVWVLSMFGIDVTALLAGLGVGGIAIAFALQGVLGDLFASFSIYLDKPFRIGDYIVIGGDSGIVERIGIKTTRIRTLQGEELVVSNTELTTARLQNFKKMEERRVKTVLGVTYETPQDLVKKIPDTVSQLFSDLDGCRLDRCHFKSFGDSALLFEVVYYVETAEYAEFMNIQQDFNFMLLEVFAQLGIEFAYPTQMVYHKEMK